MKIAFVFASLGLGLVACRVYPARQQASIEVFPTKHSTLLGVKGPQLSGTIFTTDYLFKFPSALTADSIVRFTPNSQEIAAAEHLVRTQLKALNWQRINQTLGHPVLENNLPAYFRQYVGLINRKGEKVIHLNFHWNKYSTADKLKGYTDHRLQYNSAYSVVFDGGSYYWQVDANLTRKQLSNLWVNSFA